MKKVILIIILSLVLVACGHVGNEIISKSLTTEREDYTHLFGITNNKCTIKNLKDINEINIVVEEWVDGILENELYNGVADISELDQVTFYYNYTSEALKFSGDLSIFEDLKIDYEMRNFTKFKSSNNDLTWDIGEGMYVAGYFNAPKIYHELIEVNDYISDSKTGIVIKVVLLDTPTSK